MATQFSSPTITPSMTSSFDSLSSIHSFSDDNDYIVWDISDSMTESSSELTESSISLSLAFDDDFIVLTRRSPSDIVLSPAVPQEATEDYRSSYQSVVAELSTIDFNIPPPSLPPRSPKAARKAKVATPKPKRPKKEKAKATKTATAANAQASTRPSKKHPTTTVTPSSAAPSKPPAKPQKAKKSKSKIKKKKAATQAPPSKPVAKTGLGTRPIVDDVSSDAGRDSNPDLQSWHYDDAKQYISCFLSNPARDTTNHLTLLQSLIIELGLCNAPPRPKNKTQSTVLPRTLTAAKAFVKSHVFVNIRDYLAVREQGQAAVQAVMHPSKTALIKDIRKNGNRASLKWVKKHGLQVLLVTCYY